jgi:hypothetical protein
MVYAKFLFRLMHIVSTMILSGSAVFDYLFNTGELLHNKPYYASLHIIAGVAIFVSGLTNLFILKAGKKLSKKEKVWVHLLSLKFLLALLLTPLIKPV